MQALSEFEVVSYSQVPSSNEGAWGKGYRRGKNQLFLRIIIYTEDKI